MAQLTKEQRYTIFVMYKQGFSITEIAKTINKDKSVVSREIKRNSDEKGRYRFTYAQEMADMRKERLSKPRTFMGEIENRIIRYIRDEQWSPEQIVGYCRLKGYAMVSVERIYQYIRKDKKNGGDLWKFCRHRLKHRAKPVGGSPPIKDRISIDLRPPEADGTRFGDLEMDLIVDGQQHVILTLVERSTNMLMMERIPTGKKAEPIAKTVTRLLMPYRGTIKTITTDNGSEFAAHHLITKGLYMRGKEDVIVYFTDAYSSWQKGCIENTNKLIRKYIPKQANFNQFSDAYIKKIQKKLNRRPREKLNFSTPKDCFFKHFP